MDTQPDIQKTDNQFDLQLRPRSLQEFIGHESICERLKIVIGAAKKRDEPLGHILFSGPPGLGKTTLANILSQEMGSRCVVTSGPSIDKAGDLAGILTNLEEGDILFIDEIHRLNRSVEEYLYPAIEDFSLDLMLDTGPNARSVQVTLNRFTLVGATTRVGYLSSPLRSRFHLTSRLEYYSIEAITKIILRSSHILSIPLDELSAKQIAKRSRGTPRTANNLLRWVRDYSEMNHTGNISPQMVSDALDMLCIDDEGLDEMDKKFLRLIIDHHDGGPVGLNTIAAALGEEPETIAEVHEPYLIMQGFLKRTPRGREATSRAYQHLEEK